MDIINNHGFDDALLKLLRIEKSILNEIPEFMYRSQMPHNYLFVNRLLFQTVF